MGRTSSDAAFPTAGERPWSAPRQQPDHPLRPLFPPPGEFLPFFLPLAWVIAIASVVLIVPCVWYFAVHPATRRRPTPEPLVGVPS